MGHTKRISHLVALIEAAQMRHYHEKLNFLSEGGRWCIDKEVGLDGTY